MEFSTTFSHKLKDYSQKIRHEAQLDLEKQFDPSPLIFSPFVIKHQKERRKEEKSLVVTIGVNPSTSLNVSGGGEVS